MSSARAALEEFITLLTKSTGPYSYACSHPFNQITFFSGAHCRSLVSVGRFISYDLILSSVTEVSVIIHPHGCRLTLILILDRSSTRGDLEWSIVSSLLHCPDYTAITLLLVPPRTILLDLYDMHQQT